MPFNRLPPSPFHHTGAKVPLTFNSCVNPFKAPAVTHQFLAVSVCLAPAKHVYLWGQPQIEVNRILFNWQQPFPCCCCSLSVGQPVTDSLWSVCVDISARKGFRLMVWLNDSATNTQIAICDRDKSNRSLQFKVGLRGKRWKIITKKTWRRRKFCVIYPIYKSSILIRQIWIIF